MHWKNALSTTLKTLTAHDRIGLVTDVDGTISPIVPHPDDAQVTPRSRELLAALQSRLALVAVISGRAAGDVRDRVGLPELVYVGNHGLEWWRDGQITLAPAAAQYRPALDAVIRALDGQIAAGMQVEDKGATLSIHYRRAADPPAVAEQFAPILREVAAAHDLALFQGRMVFELRPPVEINKGSAFGQLVEQYRLDAAVYLGDDTTDADALRLARTLRESGRCYALGLGVESDDMPAVVRASADLLLSGIQDVESFLAWMLSAASASST
ncbi:MAG: trehalose-phosphatase [Anaerolineae bacterium]|nr:trehalose-phosphatase [Anaerolineae bacterium]